MAGLGVGGGRGGPFGRVRGPVVGGWAGLPGLLAGCLVLGAFGLCGCLLGFGPWRLGLGLGALGLLPLWGCRTLPCCMLLLLCEFM